MDITRLTAMANDIAAFFDSEADKAVAAEGVRSHITRFWEPRMRREIIEHVRHQGGTGLSETARAGIVLLKPRTEGQ